MLKKLQKSKSSQNSSEAQLIDSIVTGRLATHSRDTALIGFHWVASDFVIAVIQFEKNETEIRFLYSQFNRRFGNRAVEWPVASSNTKRSRRVSDGELAKESLEMTTLEMSMLVMQIDVDDLW